MDTLDALCIPMPAPCGACSRLSIIWHVDLCFKKAALSRIQPMVAQEQCMTKDELKRDRLPQCLDMPVLIGGQILQPCRRSRERGDFSLVEVR